MITEKKEPVRSYEQAVAELESILDRLSAADVTLEESIDKLIAIVKERLGA